MSRRHTGFAKGVLKEPDGGFYLSGKETSFRSALEEESTSDCKSIRLGIHIP